MRIRKQKLGDRNIVGRVVEERRKALNMKQKDLLTQLQIKGIEINSSGLSKIEGQLRSVNDYELKALSEILNISVNEMLGMDK
ncbi:MAG: XRE family transcriptional regulator [Clostridia bacterium]|jgi:transcriptional regulator with XRE-family HTH domain|nr:XRE family transcriptional regulator [Clostridia bacterium]